MYSSFLSPLFREEIRCRIDSNSAAGKCEKRFRSKYKSCPGGDGQRSEYNKRCQASVGERESSTGCDELLPMLRREIGGREVGVMKDSGCEGIVVRKKVVVRVS
ncbi:hypothetical protein PoB_000306600 [Plakobranchus ocellatus]|uniref:Uncharacterized protein n=1 Tax=Plakobranchus ocellatus TaxID=259542 RepID=A0AAV3Y0E7_9GAST|nr:hypothetical protein PoB_000306600 [Plakobranchus ocellatus]